MTAEEFDRIVAGFYGAASGTMIWADALRPFQRAMDAFAIYLFAIDDSRGSVTFSHDASNWPPEADLDYIRTYHRIDPHARLAMRVAPGEWTSGAAAFDDDFVARDRFFQDFLIPYGGRYVDGTKLMQDGSVSVMLGVHRGMGRQPLDLDELATCKRLAIHLTEALKINRASIRIHQERRVGIELLAKLRVPIIVLDERRRIHHLNPVAERVLSGERPLLVQNAGHLYCNRPADDASLLIGLRELLRRDLGYQGQKSSDRIFLPIGERARSNSLGLFLHALRPNETMSAFGNEPLAMVLLHDPGNIPALDPLLVAAAYDLTPAEARVAVAMALGSSPALIASERGVSVNTIRTQLQIVFQKTSTTRQSELVRLLAGFQMAAQGF